MESSGSFLYDSCKKEGNLSNRFCSRDLSFVGWKNKAVEMLIAQARLAAVRCVCVVVHT